MKQVTIVGLGMIGTSLGLALKQLKNPPRVIGNDIKWGATRQASSAKAVDKIERDPVVAVAGSDVVVVATPIGAVAGVLQEVAGALAEGCLVTDTGSTKREILRRAQEILPPHVGFVGGHPMTGALTAGVDKPSAALFLDAIYCLAPSTSAHSAAVAAATKLVQDIGAIPYFVDPNEHDGLVAGVSHLPYLLSTALMRTMASETSWREMSILAAGGFDVATRLAEGDPKMFVDILATNGDNVARHIDRMIQELSALREKILKADETLTKDLEEGQRRRFEWEGQRKARKSE